MVLALGVARIFNFAHGEFYTLSAYIVYFMFCMYHIPFALAIVLAVLGAGLLGALCYRYMFRYVREDLLSCAAISVGLMLILRQGALIVFGTQVKSIPSVLPGVVTIGNIILPMEKLLVIAVCLSVMLGLRFLLMNTKLGRAMRATAEDAEASSLQGINLDAIYLVILGLSCALAGAAGAIIAPAFSVTPTSGWNMFIVALMVLVVGGMTSIVGGVVGGILVGLFLSFGYYFVGGAIHLFLFVVAGVILILRPWGVFGRAIEIR